MIEEFDKYVRNYDFSNSKVERKYNHSHRVMELNRKYAKILGFNNHEIEVATIIGLLHDIGRFEQIKQFNTFDDSISFDHASYGVKLLFEDGLIKNFWNNTDDYEVIRFAIENHNKFAIEKTDNKRALMHAKLIRDTDKLDIMRIYGNLNEIDLKVCDDEISSEVIKEFMNHQSVLSKNIKNINDKTVLSLSFAFDINHDECLEEFKEYYTNYYYKLKKLSSKFDNIYEEAIKYINERIDKYVRNKI